MRSDSVYGINKVLELMKEKSGKMTSMRLDGN